MSSLKGLVSSSRKNPCPICGRIVDGDCRISEKLVLCHHGQRKHPPRGLRPGDVIDGKDGQKWAFTGETDDGRAAVYTLDKLRHRDSRVVSACIESTDRQSESAPITGPVELARMPHPPAEPPDHLPHGHRLAYSPSQTVVVRVAAGGKRHIPHHFNSDGLEVCGAGPDQWPLWREADALEYGRGHWLAEAEGEKCGDWLRAGGLVAISQPGHDYTFASIERRYRMLLEGTISGVVYLADNDPTGARKAKMCEAAAAAAGLPLLVISAAEVWNDLPVGGSIDDAPGSAAERVYGLLAAIANVVQDRQQISQKDTTTLSQQKKVQPRPGSKSRNGERKLSHTWRMNCLERCVEVLSARERNSRRRQSKLLRAARSLGLDRDIHKADIARMVLEAKDQQQGNSYRGLTAAERLAMEWPDVEWLVPDLLPANDLTIVGGRPKVGKTAIAMNIAAAVLKGRATMGFLAATPRPVVVISDDQGDADTKHALIQLGVFDHPALIWSRRFRLTESDLDRLLVDVRQNPGALVVMDSLRSVSRTLDKGENDPEIGAVIYDLKAAVMDADGTLLLVHHCNKAPGLTGVEALSGHNAIAGAANTVITLHYVENDKGHPDKEAEQRRLVREARTGKPLDLVISRTAGTGEFHQIGTWSSWQEQIQQARSEAKREARQTGTQSDVLEALEEREGQWLTCREVVTALGLPWGSRGNGKDAVRVRDALNRLVDDGEILRVRAGTAYTYSVVSDVDQLAIRTQIESTPSTTSAELQRKGFGRRGKISAISTPGTPAELAEVVEIEPLHSNPLQGNGAELVEVSEVGSAVEVRQSDGSWYIGYRLADIVETSLGARARIEAIDGTDYRVVPLEDLRICEETRLAELMSVGGVVLNG